MNNFEVVIALNKMIAVTKSVSREANVCYIKKGLVIDKNEH